MDKDFIKQVIGSLTDEEALAFCTILENLKGGNNMESNEMKHSAMDFINEAMKSGSLKETLLIHAENYGIENIEELFPDAKDVNNQPLILNNQVGWVSNVLNNTYKQPFSRIKSSFSDQTGDDLRAKGYIRGKRKTEEVVSIIKRSTSPTTIYKKQKLDRDDIIDITDFSVVAWIKSNMRMKLNEEIARCVLVGDGRSSVSDDYIDKECIRPIHTDDDVYSIKVSVEGADASTKAANFIEAVIRNRKLYKGSGSPTMYIGEDFLADMLLLRDNNGRLLYSSEQELAKTLRVKEIVSVPLFDEEIKREDKESKSHTLLAMIVNLADYSIGADKGGKVAMFEDFDIDYNQEKYLIETRCSGALTKPYSAMVFETPTPETPLPPENQVPGTTDEEVL